MTSNTKINDELIDKLVEIVKGSNNIVFFGGAGVSCESNIPDFRSANGLYNEDSGLNISVEEIISKSFFYSNPKEFFKFYKSKMIYKYAKPNDCHYALTKLEEIGKLKTCITQNIDNLHTMAKTKNVLELHGNVFRNHCIKCHKFFDVNFILNNDIPRCDCCKGIVKPDVVLYEESLDVDVLTKSINYIAKCDTLIIGGTSLQVYPAAGLVQYFQGKNLIIINKSVTQYDRISNLIIQSDIGVVFKKLIKKLGI